MQVKESTMVAIILGKFNRYICFTCVSISVCMCGDRQTRVDSAEVITNKRSSDVLLH